VKNDESNDRACCAPKLALSLEEEAILKRMRELHQRSRLIKERLSEAEDDAQVRSSLELQLEELRRRFRQLRVELKQANRTKMISLGHEP
jgi:hypothetical protein